MKFVVEISDELLANAKDISGLSKDSDVVKLSLIMLLKLGLKRQAKIRRYRGKLEHPDNDHENGDRDDMRIVK